MNATEYKTNRQKRGTQQEVANLLNVGQSTISDRERGRLEITKEIELALLSLPAKKPKTKS